jgi:phosphoketolase
MGAACFALYNKRRPKTTIVAALDRFHLVMDASDRLAETGGKGIYLKQLLLKDKHRSA